MFPTMTRLMLDTCAVIDLISSSDYTDLEFWDVLDAPETMAYASFETARELVVLFNNKKFFFKTMEDGKANAYVNRAGLWN